MFTKPISQIELIEIPINEVKTRYYFGEQPDLKNKIIHRIQTIGPGYTVLSNRINIASYQNSFLVLVNKSKQIINRMPLIILDNNGFYPEFNINVDWQNSYIEFTDTTNVVVGGSINLTVYVIDRKDVGSFNHELVTLLVRNTSDLKIKFDDIPLLANKKIKSIMFVDAISPEGTIGVASGIYQKSFLILNVKGTEKINGFSLIDIKTTATMEYNFLLDDLNINWKKSYVQLPNNINLVANTSYMFSVLYEDLKPSINPH